MKGLVGLWKTYRPGEIYGLLGQLISDVRKEGKRIRVAPPLEPNDSIGSVEELYQVLERYEQDRGTDALLKALADGFVLEGEPHGPRIHIFLRFPVASGRERRLFTDLIVNAIARDADRFTERYFGERSGSLFHSRLERLLKKRFGFCIEYKIIIEPSKEG